MPSKPKTREKPAPPTHSFDAELDVLASLAEQQKSGAPFTPEQIEYIRKTLSHRNNFLASKAARLCAELELAQFLPDILAAYDRFFHDPVKTDPQCWAKNALAAALVKLGHRQRDAYLHGMRHHQMEPVWGGQSDTAGTLRATCAHALVDCPGISDADLLVALLDPLTDLDKSVRVEAARAIANIGGVSAALLLRLRVLLSSVIQQQGEPEVLGAVFASLLSLEGASAIPLVAKSLEAEDDAAAEAAFALADLRTPESLAPLLAHLRAGADPSFIPILLTAVALTRLPEALETLIALIARDAREAPDALEALARIAPTAELLSRIQAAVDQADSLRVKQAFNRLFDQVPK